jgi:hypothetical protein
MALSAAALIAAGCGSSSKSTTARTTGAPAGGSTPETTAATAPAATTETTTSPTGLSVVWDGQYNGAYTGTFVLNWTQSGSNLGGSIKLSAPETTLSVNGSLQGSFIRFGTVGSVAITYTGSVSGGSMTGSYSTPTGGGGWSATKK